jgi:phosphoribosylanthranilate isomerase
MTWVKVCGLSRPEEVAAAVKAGADAVGFVTVPGSPRFVEIARVAELAADVRIRRVLLTIDLTPAELLAAVGRAEVDAVQPYGRHATGAARAGVDAGLLVLQPIRLGEGVGEPDVVEGAIPLFDAHHRSKYGGTGERFDWALLDGREGDFVVAGGLGPGNVTDLIDLVKPWGVDASSGLESAPGKKDLGKVAEFVGRAKGT